jgi:hypothetical protein
MDRRALRAEFELASPRGLAVLRAYAASIEERERIGSHRAAARQPTRPAADPASRSGPTSR